MWGSGVVTPAPAISARRRWRARYGRPTTLPPSRARIRLPVCPTSAVWHAVKTTCRVWRCSSPGISPCHRPSSWRARSRRPASRSARRSPTAMALPSRWAMATSCRPTRWVSATVSRTAATRCRSGPSPVGDVTCSVTAGIRPPVRRPIWPRPRPWVAMRPSAPCPDWAHASSAPARCRCCSRHRWRWGCWVVWCRRSAARHCTGRHRSWWIRWASASSPTTSTSWKIRSSPVRWAPAPSTTRAWPRLPVMW